MNEMRVMKSYFANGPVFTHPPPFPAGTIVFAIPKP